MPGITETTSSVKIFGTVKRLFDFDLNRASLDFFSAPRKKTLLAVKKEKNRNE